MPAPQRPILLAAVALLVLAGACGESKRYRGPEFEIGLPEGYDWTLASSPQAFRLAPPLAQEGLPDVARLKRVELLCASRRASVEVFVVNSGAAPPEKFTEAILRKPQRRYLTEGEPKAITVGGRRGQALIASWQQTREAPKVLFYCVRVPAGARLWLFVASAEEAQYDSLRPDIEAILQTVKFH